MRNGNETAPASAPADEALCRQAQQGDGRAAEELVKRYTRLVKTCARPYFLAGADEEDLLQEGMLGLMRAIREFDAARGAPFGAFARLCVTRRIYSAARAAHLFCRACGGLAAARSAQPFHVDRSTSV